MAVKITETYTDDIDGSEATYKGVLFAFEGTEYSIDLSEANYNDLKAAFEKFSAHATKVSGPGRGRGRSTAAASTGSARERKEELAAVRNWAEQHDIALPARGRIAQTVMDAYHAGDPSLAKKAS